MKSSLGRAVGLLVLNIGLWVGCHQSQQIPPTPHHYVTDTVNLLTKETREDIEAQLEVYEKRTKHQVFVWIGRSTNGEDPATWALRAFNAWGIGRSGKDDGVALFVFAKDDLRWITVGYGLESALPDKECTRICREVIAPRMRAGHPNEALRDGVQSILVDIDTWESKKAQ